MYLCILFLLGWYSTSNDATEARKLRNLHCLSQKVGLDLQCRKFPCFPPYTHGTPNNSFYQQKNVIWYALYHKGQRFSPKEPILPFTLCGCTIFHSPGLQQKKYAYTSNDPVTDFTPVQLYIISCVLTYSGLGHLGWDPLVSCLQSFCN